VKRILLAAALLAAAVAPALAQNAWPQKPVKIVNNFPPGGPSDTIARSVADVLATQFRQLHDEGLVGAAASRRLGELSERYGKVIRSTGMKVE
jgi:tripartite-type tricarboxylate transporter receptor subunit TctC